MVRLASRGSAGMALVLGLFLLGCAVSSRLGEEEPLEVKLPEPRPSGEMSVEEALAARRSVRSYQDEALSLTELAQLLWAAQGITAHWGGRTAPSAGATYPLEVYAVVGEVIGLEAGVFHYRPDGHLFVRRTVGDLRGELASAALGQEWVREAPVSLVIAARYERTTRRVRRAGGALRAHRGRARRPGHLPPGRGPGSGDGDSGSVRRSGREDALGDRRGTLGDHARRAARRLREG